MTSPLLLSLVLAANLTAAAEEPAVPAPPTPPPAAGAPAKAKGAPSGAAAKAKGKDATKTKTVVEDAEVDEADSSVSAAPHQGTRRTGEWPAKPSGKTVTLEGAMTIDQALGKISAAAGWNLVSTSGPDGARSLTLRLHRVPVEEALDAVLQSTSLVAQRRGSIVTVSPGLPGARAAGPGAAVVDGTKSAKELRRELRKQVRERLREAKRAAREQRGGKADRVARGDQVVKAGESPDDVVVLLGSVTLEPGATAQQVVAVVGSVVIGEGATVESDVVAVGGDIHLMPGAHVGGDTVSVGGQVIAEEGATIDGERTSVDVPGLAHVLTLVGARAWSPQASRALSFASLIARFVVFFALALLIMSVAPRRLEILTAGLSNAPVKTAVTGVLGTLAIPLAAILLAVTVIGIPLIAVLVLAVLVAVAMGYAALALFIGRAIPLRVEKARTVLQLAIGTGVILLLGQIPVLGWMVWITGWLFVVGVIWRTRFGRPPVAPTPIYGTTPPPPTMPPPMPPIDPPIPPAPTIPPPAGNTGT